MASGELTSLLAKKNFVNTLELSSSERYDVGEDGDVELVGGGNLEDGVERPVSVTLTYTVKAIHYEKFLEWQRGIIAVNKSLGGVTGATIIEEKVSGDNDLTVFIVILKFRSFESAHKWNLSETRTKWMEKLSMITGDTPIMPAKISVDEVPVFANVFHSKISKEQGFWWNRRMWFLIWMQVYLLVLFFAWLNPIIFQALHLDDNWEVLSFEVKILVDTFLTTIFIDLLTMGLVVRFCKWIGFL